MVEKSETDSARARTKSYLDDVVEQAGKALRGWMLYQSANRAVERALPLLMIAPAMILIGQLLFLDSKSWSLNIGWVIALSVGAALTYFIAYLLLVAVKMKTPRQIALSLYDQQLSLKDRLTTADQFLADNNRGYFYSAAIEDATEFAKLAVSSEIRKIKSSINPVRPKAFLYIPASLLLILVSASIDHLGDLSWKSDAIDPTDISLSSSTLSNPDSEHHQSDNADPGSENLNSEAGITQASDSELPIAQIPQEQFESTNSSGTMKSALPNNSSAGAGGSSEGSPVASGEPKSSPDSPGKQLASAAKSNPSNSSMKSAEKGASLGGAMSSSAGRNMDMPGVDEQTSQSDSPESQQNSQQENEEENELQEAFASAKPNRHLRKPPTSRSLGFSAPSGKTDEGSNGRGGKSGLKKTRGVPSMILGVPLPDRVNGVRSPGFSKTMQEKVSPKTKSMPEVVSQARQSRSSSVGDMLQHQPTAEIKNLLKAYFMSLREQDNAEQND
ncbi:hypothetical protein QSV34_12445 [Porticoccus sp. W117]|uniref:hypothetical protein n=1 Tax=Porticoccus sp. W117 TaxID=3054777 RepID=UPI002594317D|nr:hypothetical protein [Porticoccus sp. W117]MDM3872155.1 hypothetical protein [Porticoccus sp. W117]